ncbi:phosphoribosylaminoimidazolesuccinocarboxamide synthase, partial [Candidatus Bathyarchaeota archaeon]|nr:phosphoribosylaminoimidazolesuccinocarboxamide synthase [Candidatus Bathyarchaeota archaeon]
MRLIKSGKVKDVYAVNDKELEFEFSNRISVFDKIIPSEIPNKGETLARTSAYWFELIQKLGISTHYLG